MPAAVIPIGDFVSAKRRATWSLIEMAQPGRGLVPLGILLVDDESDDLTIRLRAISDLDDLEEQETDILDALSDDLLKKSRETGGRALLDSLEDSFSWFLRIT